MPTTTQFKVAKEIALSTKLNPGGIMDEIFAVQQPCCVFSFFLPEDRFDTWIAALFRAFSSVPFDSQEENEIGLRDINILLKWDEVTRDSYSSSTPYRRFKVAVKSEKSHAFLCRYMSRVQGFFPDNIVFLSDSTQSTNVLLVKFAVTKLNGPERLARSIARIGEHFRSLRFDVYPSRHEGRFMVEIWGPPQLQTHVQSSCAQVYIDLKPEPHCGTKRLLRTVYSK